MPMSLRSEAAAGRGEDAESNHDSDSSSASTTKTNSDDTLHQMLRQMNELRKALAARDAELAALRKVQSVQAPASAHASEIVNNEGAGRPPSQPAVNSESVLPGVASNVVNSGTMPEGTTSKSVFVSTAPGGAASEKVPSDAVPSGTRSGEHRSPLPGGTTVPIYNRVQYNAGPESSETWPPVNNRVSAVQGWVEAGERRPYEDVHRPAYGDRYRDSVWRDNVLARQTGVRDLPSFDGNPAEWQGFKLIFEETTRTFGWTDAENRARLNHALRGEARRVVGPTLYWAGTGASARVMAALDEHYGSSDTAEAIVKEMLVKHKVRSNGLVLEEVHEFCLLIDNAISTLAPVRSGALLRDPKLLGQFLTRMPAWECLRWADAYGKRQGERSLLELSEFYHQLRETLKSSGFMREQKLPKTRARPVMTSYTDGEADDEAFRPSITAPPVEPRRPKCAFCNAPSHKSQKCRGYLAKNVSERWNAVRGKKLCFACLASTHTSPQCKAKCPAEGCGKAHHPSLHNTNAAAAPSAAVVTNTWRAEQPVLLKVLPVKVSGPRGEREIYALLDEGSTVTLLEEEVAKDIGAKGRSSPLRLSGVQSMTTPEVQSMRVKTRVRGDGATYTLHANTVQGISLPSQIVATSREDLRRPGCPVTPLMLIGQDNAHLIVSRELRETAGDPTILSRTALGWTIHGGACEAPRLAVALCVRRDAELDALVRGHFAVDSLGVTSAHRTTAAEERAVRLMKENFRPTSDGRWETCLLWERDDSWLPDNKEAAMKRLTSLERKLARDPQLAAAYRAKMQSYVDEGYARPIQHGETRKAAGRRWFLPHFAVQNKPGKIRIVFDAAAEYRGASLNKRLLTGPDLLSSLVGNILRFREGKIGIAADIKDMFLRIKMRPEDTLSQLFLWRDNPEEPPKTYVFTSVLFGARCSPASAQYVRDAVAESQRGEHPEAADAIQKKFYMDDYLDAAHSTQEAVRKVKQVRQVLIAGGFRLVNWACNHPAVLNAVPSEERAKSLIDIGGPDPAQERILGVKWDPAGDSFVCEWSQPRDTAWPTKRSLLASVMRVFDPLGFIACLTIRAKILLQDVWRAKTDWDEGLTEDHEARWRDWLTAVEAARTRIPRCCRFDPKAEASLHLFADASEQACCAVAYLVERHTDGGPARVSFLGAKTKVAPLRPISIPRLELQAALMAARFAASIRREMSLTIARTWYWSDSTTVLHWIRTDPRAHNAFVANRLGEIDELTCLRDWRWVPTKMNPADAGTRDGELPDTSEAGLWFQGPAFIREEEDAWPADKTAPPAEEDGAKQFVGEVERAPTTILDAARFSSWPRLLRTAAWMLRFVKRCRGQIIKGPLTAPELQEAEIRMLQAEQKRAFAKELSALARSEAVGPASRIAGLNPFMGNDGLLRMRSRVQAAEMEEGLKTPVILDGDGPYTRLLIRHRHEAAGHPSTEKTVAELRRDLAIIKLRGQVRQIVNRCLPCRQRKAMPAPPLMGELPEGRLAYQQRPFTHCGVDFFGPLTVVIGRRHEKRYGALFTCLTTRAVHLELVHSLEADAMIMALRRMTARRGTPKVLYSDNATNFHGADKEMRVAIEEVLADEKWGEKLAGDRIEWRFIPPSSPHMGGAWERLVRSVKEALRATLGNQTLKPETLLTALAEAEHTVNSRPLTHISADPEEDEPLTPNHFLIGASSGRPCLAFYGPEADEVCLRKQWRLAQQLGDKFWRRWLREYVPTIQKRSRWQTTATPLQIGNLVWVLDPTQPRNTWPKGVVTRVNTAADGQVRSAEIRTTSGTYTRPAAKLITIPMGELPPGASGGEAERSRGECSGRQ